MRLFMRLTARPAVVVLLALSFGGRAAAVEVTYLHGLADFSGTVPYNDARLHVDGERDEVYAAVGNSVRVFNSAGMEIHRFDLDPASGSIQDLAVEASGDILLLTLVPPGAGVGGAWFILRCDYRGEPIGRVSITGLPPELASFTPGVMGLDAGRIVLVSMSDSRALVADRSGAFRRAYDLAGLAGIADADRRKHGLAGFGIGPGGDMLFTIPTLFRAFDLSPEGALRTFGRPGSVAGTFGVIAGIAADNWGHVLVADMLRGVVMVFDRDLEFVSEFGVGADDRGGLVRPADLAVGPSGKVYVTQTRDRGVAVFRLESGGGAERGDAEPLASGGAGENGKSSNEPGRDGTGVSPAAGRPIELPAGPS